MRKTAGTSIIGAVTLALLTGSLGEAAAPGKVKRPRLDVRPSPRITFSPAQVLVTAELRGGDEAEEFYCPAVEWDWDDGSRSTQESDCAPIEEGGRLERRFTNTHAYRRAGTYNVKVTIRRAERAIAVASATITVRPGLGDLSSSPD